MSESAEEREYGNFTMNYLEGSGRWRGVIKVPVRNGDGQVLSWIERRYEGIGPKRADKGTEYISLYVRGPDPMAAARERNIPVNLAPNKPASYTARAVNRGTLFLPNQERLSKAEAEGKSLPAAQGYLLIMIEGQPTYVEVGSWPRSRKPKTLQGADSNGSDGPKEAGAPAAIDFYSGPAEIHDPAAALARKMARAMTGRDPAASEDLEMAPAGFVDAAPELNGDHASEHDAEEAGANYPGPRKRRTRVEPAA